MRDSYGSLPGETERKNLQRFVPIFLERENPEILRRLLHLHYSSISSLYSIKCSPYHRFPFPNIIIPRRTVPFFYYHRYLLTLQFALILVKQSAEEYTGRMLRRDSSASVCVRLPIRRKKKRKKKNYVSGNRECTRANEGGQIGNGFQSIFNFACISIRRSSNPG